MKKIILVIGLALATLLALTSCGAKYSFNCEVENEIPGLDGKITTKINIEANDKEFTKYEVSIESDIEDFDNIMNGQSFESIDEANEGFKNQDKSMSEFFDELLELIKSNDEYKNC